MKATSKQIYLAASNIASGCLAHPANTYGSLEGLANMSVKIATMLAEKINDDEQEEKVMPLDELKKLMETYTFHNTPTNRTRLSNLLQADAGYAKYMAEALIDRAVFHNIIKEYDEGKSKVYKLSHRPTCPKVIIPQRDDDDDQFSVF